MTDLRDYSARETLRDGTVVRLRSVRPSDKAAFRDGFRQLSTQSVYHRFFQTKSSLSDTELTYLTEVDFRNHVALVVVLDQELDTASGHHHPGELVAVARFVRLPAARGADLAEVAFTVGDEMQGRGIATHLLRHLAAIGRQLGIRAFVAEVLPDNHPMLKVFAHSGLAVTEEVVDGSVHVEMPLGLAAPLADAP